MLFYDPRDATVARRARDHRITWLRELGAASVEDAKSSDQGFVFAGARPIDDYAQLTHDRPNLRDRPDDRAPLLRLDSVLDRLTDAGVSVPTPSTWRLEIDQPLPTDLRFPLFVRTAATSFKLGGHVSRVRNATELMDEAEALRRWSRWDARILAREWLDLAAAGYGVYGPIPQEVRVWIVDQVPFAWSFHYLNVLPNPDGFPPTADDLCALAEMAGAIGRAFTSRLVVADFARLKSGGWVFIEAGPGSCAGTAHESVFKAVAARLEGQQGKQTANALGGPMPESRYRSST